MLHDFSFAGAMSYGCMNASALFLCMFIYISKVYTFNWIALKRLTRLGAKSTLLRWGEHTATKGTYGFRAVNFAAAYRKRENLIVLKENTLASEWRHNLISRLTDRICYVRVYVVATTYSLFSLRGFNLIFCCFGILVHRAPRTLVALLLPLLPYYLGCCELPSELTQSIFCIKGKHPVWKINLS